LLVYKIKIAVFGLIMKFRNILRKEGENSDGKQFHQYRQSEQLPLTWNHRTQTNPRYNPMEIQVPHWDRHTNVAGLSRLTVCQPSLSVNM